MKYVVCDEHTLGYLMGNGWVGVLHESVLKGAAFSVHPGPKVVSQFSNVRPATLEDFAEFRVMVPPDFKPNDPKEGMQNGRES